tara:strand:- start:171 stop:719 length:549 start_codon:yes stop_codon:yes gene_type:complete
MKCQHCNKNEASIELNQVIEGRKEILHMCESCAQKMKPSSPLVKSGFMSGLLDTINNSGLQVNYIKTTACSACGMTFGKYKELGQLGCHACYEAFNEKLNPLIRRIHGSDRHSGKMPVKYRGTAKIQRELVRLKGQLDQTIRREAFEEAAMIRDRIRALEQTMEDHKTTNKSQESGGTADDK